MIVLTLGPKPYYWPNTKEVVFGGSPPLAIRAGWIALGLLPFVMSVNFSPPQVKASLTMKSELLRLKRIGLRR